MPCIDQQTKTITFTVDSIPLSEINHTDDSYRVTTNNKCEDLIESISEIGLINLPILRQNQHGYYIISGFRRIAACRNLKLNSIQARIVVKCNSEIELVKLVIADNSCQRSLNLIECSRSIQLLNHHITEKKDLFEISEKLGIVNSLPLFTKIEKLCRLPDLIQNCILDNTISLSMAIELSTLKKEEGVAFALLFKNLQIGLNLQNELMTLIQEISSRDTTPLLAILYEKELQELVKSEEYTRPQISQQIRLYLRKMRYPRITAYEKKIRTDINNLKLGPKTVIKPPKNFEGTGYNLNLAFHNIHDLKNHQSTLEKLIKSPELKSILNN